MKKNVVRGFIVLLICCVIIPMLSCAKSDVDNIEKIVFWDSYYIGVNDANIPETGLQLFYRQFAKLPSPTGLYAMI